MDIDWAKQKGITLNFQKRRYAVNSEGKYLHFSGQMSTNSAHYAWHGSPEQFINLCAQFPHARNYKLQVNDDE